MVHRDGQPLQQAPPDKGRRIQHAGHCIRIRTHQPSSAEKYPTEVADHHHTHIAQVGSPTCCPAFKDGVKHRDAGGAGGLAVVVGPLDQPVRAEHHRAAMVPGVAEFTAEVGEQCAGVIFAADPPCDCDETGPADVGFVAVLTLDRCIPGHPTVAHWAKSSGRWLPRAGGRRVRVVDMLRIGLTGGIAAGKSLVASRLGELGAVLVDADVLAREAVGPGSAGLAAVAAEFGAEVLLPDGSLDRPALAAAIFGNPSRRMTLNSLIHPLVRERARQLSADAPRAAVVVQDIPLLVETNQQHQFHLVVVVDAPDVVRIERLTSLRGMSDADARSRIAAQAARAERVAAADVVLVNEGSPDELLAAVDQLWLERLAPFNANLLRGVRAARVGGPRLLPPQADWPVQAERIMGRLLLADPRVLAVDHIGSTAVPDLPAKDVIDLQMTVADIDDADGLAGALLAAGFPLVEGIASDVPKPDVPDPARWVKRLHANADPGRAVNLHVRVEGSPGWRYALSFRDWLRADPTAAGLYLAEKKRCATAHAADKTSAGYAACKEEWFTAVADLLLKRWVADTGWEPGHTSAVG